MYQFNLSIRIPLFVFLLGLTIGCAAPFSYSADRCLGAYNQCRNACKDIDSGPAQSACYERCSERETLCYSSGDDGAGSSLSQESLIGLSRKEAEKEAGYRAWKAEREREAAEKAGKAGPPVPE